MNQAVPDPVLAEADGALREALRAIPDAAGNGRPSGRGYRSPRPKRS